jgi:hypothetical protein
VIGLQQQLDPQSAENIKKAADRLKSQTEIIEFQNESAAVEAKAKEFEKANGRPPDAAERNQIRGQVKREASGTVGAGGWSILTDPTKKDESGNPIQYRYNTATGEATTLDMKPYQPGGAQKVGTSSSSDMGSFTDSDVKYWAGVLKNGGHFPPGFTRGRGGPQFVQRVMHEVGATGDPNDFITNQATVKADDRSLSNMTKMADAATSFERTASQNFDTALRLAKDAVPTDWGPWLNHWVMTGETQMGDTNVPPHVTAMLTGANEYAKIMSGSTGAQGSTVDSRREAAELFSPYLSKGQIERVVEIAKTDMQNRKGSLYGQIDDIKNRLRSAGSPAPTESLMDPNKSAPSGGVLRYDAQGNRVQ